MELSFNHNGNSYSFSTLHPLDISLAVRHDGLGANCFYTDRPVFKPYRAGNFVGDVNKGGACNVDIINFTPHGNGTHTECIGHITAQRQVISDSLHQGIQIACLITVSPELIDNDQVITLNCIKSASIETGIDALIVRTLPNENVKKSFEYSGTNPAYFSPEALGYVNKLEVKHLLCDIPSVDREDDGGKLLAHKAFFGVPALPRLDATITELVYVPSEIRDGLFLLDLQIAPFQSDASPSRPLLYKVKKMT